MKKVLSLILCGAMALSLVACGAANGNSGKTAETEVTETAESKAEDGASKATAEATSVVAGKEYKVGIVQYVDDASLNQIEKAIEAELDKKAEELGVKFNYKDYTFNGQADSTTLTQIATQLVEDEVDIIIPIATPTACIMQSATETNQIPVVFSAVSDPVGAGLVDSMENPGSNITGTSDALDTKAILDLAFAANPEINYFGLLYDKGQDSSTKAIAEAKAYLDQKGIKYIEKTGTTNEEISLAADALVAEGVQATFTPSDNTVMTAELAIFERLANAGIAQYCGADSFALNGAFLGYGVNYEELGTVTADMAADILVNGKEAASYSVKTLEGGIATVNTETAEILGLDYSVFNNMCDEVIETVTAEEFE